MLLLIQANPKQMIVSLEAERVSQTPLTERALNAVGVAVAIAYTSDIDVGLRAGQKGGARHCWRSIERAAYTESDIEIADRIRDAEWPSYRLSFVGSAHLTVAAVDAIPVLSSPGTPATTAGSYTFSVIGTDASNLKVTVSANLTVAVQ